MSEEQNIHELIDQFLKGELERDDLDRFRNRMRNEPEFAREVELHKALVEGVEDVRHEDLKNYLRENAKVEYIGNIWSAKWLYASAAIVVVLVGMFFLLKQVDITRDVVENDPVQSKSRERIATDRGSEVERMGNTAEETDSAHIGDVDMELAVVEDEGIEESRPDQEAESYSEMGEQERKLEGDEIVDSMVKTDRLLASSGYMVTVIPTQKQYDSMQSYLKNADKNAAASSSSDQDDLKEKRGLFRRNKDKDSEDEVQTEAAKPTVQETVKRRIEVEFWSSPVNFKGYKYNGNKVLLYDVKPSENIEFLELNNQLYLKRNGQYYTISVTNNYKKFVKLTSSSVIKELNR